MLYVINPESNQVVVNSPEEVEEITGISADKIAEMLPGDFLTDGTEKGSCPANWEVVAEEGEK